jgi:hypothetical protein
MIKMTETLTPSVATPSFGAITAHDRCDSCKAQAYTRFVNENGHDLLACGHHTNAWEPALMSQGFQMIQDEREKLEIKRESSAA